MCTSCIHDNAWICARRTTDHDLASVISDEKEREKMHICNNCNILRTYCSN